MPRDASRGFMAGGLVLAATLAAATAQQPVPPAPSAVVDVVAVDAQGKPVTDLTGAELAVTLDGESRQVVGLGYVFRGAGSEEAARAVAGPIPVAAVPARLIVVAIAEPTIPRGREQAVVSAAWRVIDGFTSADRLGVVAIPAARGSFTVGGDRDTWRRTLAAVRSRAVAPPRPTSPVASAEVQSPVMPGLPATGASPDPGNPSSPSESPADRAASDRDQMPDATATGAGPSVRADARTLVLAGLADLLVGMRALPGPKALICLVGDDMAGGSLASPAAPTIDEGRSLLDTLVDTAAAARTSVHVVRVTNRENPRTDPLLADVARRTGGTVSVATPKRADLSLLTSALGGHYLVEVEGRAEDFDGRTRRLGVTSARRGVQLLVAERWMPPADPPVQWSSAGGVPAEADDPGGVPEPGLARAAAGRGGDRGRRDHDADLQAVMARVAAYVDTYLGEFGNVVAEERYRQLVIRRSSRQTRTTRSDLLLIRTGTGWTPFRDVFEVDGDPVRDRQDRLKQLFLEHPETAMAEGRRISEESARYNIGAVYRTINTPLLALSFFSSANQWAFDVRRRGEDTVDGVRTWRIEFEETGSPTQVQHATTLADLPSSGAIWVEPTSGRIVRTRVKVRQDNLAVEMTVTFRPNDALGLWTPVRMVEHYRRGDGAETIDADAAYSNFRRFQVDTAETLGPPR